MTEEELKELEAKADWYGHYADFMRVEDMIAEIRRLKAKLLDLEKL